MTDIFKNFTAIFSRIYKFCKTMIVVEEKPYQEILSESIESLHKSQKAKNNLTSTILNVRICALDLSFQQLIPSLFATIIQNLKLLP